MLVRFAICCLVVAFLGWVPARAEDTPDLRDPQRIEAGRKLFTAACSACHGKSGEGGRGPNLSDGLLIRRSTNPRLFASIKSGVPGTDMPAFPIGDEKVWNVVAYLRSFSAPAIDTMVAGNPAQGRAVFLGKGGCSGCHAIRGEGGAIGPDLTDVGGTRTIKQIRESLLDPDARIAEGFAGVSVTTATGQTLKGVAKNENNYSLQLLDSDGKLHLLDMRDLKQVSHEKGSLMPSGYGTKLTETEIDDLLAFLSRQSIRRREP